MQNVTQSLETGLWCVVVLFQCFVGVCFPITFTAIDLSLHKSSTQGFNKQIAECMWGYAVYNKSSNVGEIMLSTLLML